MKTASVVHNTFVIERAYPAAPDRVFTAFSDAARKRRWFLEGGGNQVERYELDFRIAGKEVATFRHAGAPAPISEIPFTSESVPRHPREPPDRVCVHHGDRGNADLGDARHDRVAG
jgi:uncharacterized protein YndB with AHSA1/START domain